MRNLRTSVLLACAILAVSAPSAHGLLITEFMAINDVTIADDDGQFSDWLEIYNDGAASVDIGAWYLTDNPTNLTKWQFPSVVIPAGGYLLVWASGKNRTDPAAPLHASFKLSSLGEFLALVRSDGVTIEHAYAPQFPAQSADVSYGLALDLVTERCFVNATPGAENDEIPECGFVAPVEFSVGRGFYELPFSVTLSTPTPGSTIRYTLDASDPTETNGAVYSGAIPISTTTVLRAVAFKPPLVTAPSVTHSYIFLDDVLQQSIANLPPEYPDRFGGNESADYDMDPKVVGDPLYAGELKDDLKSIPTLSLVLDVDEFLGDQNGFYKHPTSKGPKWEKAVSAEWIDPSGGDEFQVNCGVRVQGALSRFPGLKKHNLRLLFKSKYGPSKLVFPVFKDSPVDTFDTIVLTAGHGNSWAGGSKRALYIRDTWGMDTQRAMGQLAPYATYVHLYFNGLYWGLYRPVERPVASFLAAHLGGDEEDWDALRSSKMADGDKVAWDTMHELADAGLETQQAYDALLEYLDVDNLIDYMMMNQYAGNWDWDHHNWYAGRRREPGAGYMFFNWDGEHLMEKASSYALNENNRDAPSGVYADLKKENAEFRVLYGDHAHRHLFNGGALTPKAARDRFLERAKEIEGAVVAESARWGDKGGRPVPFTRDVEWLIEKQWILLSFFSKRTTIFLDQLRRKGLYPLIDAPEFNQHGGDFTAGFELTMQAPEGTVYYTDDGSDPRLPGGAIAAGAQIYSAPIPLTQAVHFKSRAWVAGEWSALSEASFIPDTPVRITELMYHPPTSETLEFVELRNVGAATVDLSGLAFTDGIGFVFPAALLAPGDHALVVSDLTAFTTFYGPVAGVVGQYTGQLGNGGERLRLEDAAGNVIQDFRYDDRWYPSSDGLGFSLVVRDATADKKMWDKASGWRASTFAGGSAGAAELRLCADGIDNDGDGLSDYPGDPGCADASQDFEDPDCDDGADNDGDALVDAADPDCDSPARDSEEADPIDSFMCYAAKTTRKTPKFESVETVLTDRFEAGIGTLVRKPSMLCLPGELNGHLSDEPTGILDEDTHLEAYAIKELPGQPRHEPRSPLETTGPLGPLYLGTKRTDLLLVPTARRDGGPADPPDDALHAVDHYKCYRATDVRELPDYFPSRAEVNFRDAFEHRDYALRKQRHFCTPVSKDGSVVKNPNGYLVCYSAKPGKFSNKDIEREALNVGNSLGQETLDTKRVREICVPVRLLEAP